jgi:DnaJ homolog subfamily C member 8
LYSNRSAAYLANSEVSKSLKDARKCLEIDPAFVKGHSRLAAALFALKRYDQAKDAYEEVLKLDKEGNSNVAAQKGIEACEKEIEKRRIEQQQTLEEEERLQQQQQKALDQNVGKDDAKPAASSSQKDGEGDGEGGGDDDEEEDDLLNDFFDEVEEVVTKKKEAAVAGVATTNAIRNDRQTLGTTQEQVDRLLQPHYEWRNLNPYWVLQLPADQATDDDISRRYKALSLLLHPDKNRATLISEQDRDKIQLAYDQVQKAKTTLNDPDRKRYIVSLIEEGMKQGKAAWHKQEKERRRHGNGSGKSDNDENTLESIQEREVMRLFAQVEQKRRDVEERERKFEQRTQQQEDDELAKERKSRQFDKSWRQGDRVDKRVGNWRDFSGGGGSSNKKRKL